MTIVPLPRVGTAAKYTVANNHGEFMMSLSYTLQKNWKLDTEEKQLDAARQMAAEIVGRHDPAKPFPAKYIFAEHNTRATLEATVAHLHKHAA
jgi:hypothetical protein